MAVDIWKLARPLDQSLRLRDEDKYEHAVRNRLNNFPVSVPGSATRRHYKLFGTPGVDYYAAAQVIHTCAGYLSEIYLGQYAMQCGMEPHEAARTTVQTFMGESALVVDVCNESPLPGVPAEGYSYGMRFWSPLFGAYTIHVTSSPIDDRFSGAAWLVFDDYPQHRVNLCRTIPRGPDQRGYQAGWGRGDGSERPRFASDQNRPAYAATSGVRDLTTYFVSDGHAFRMLYLHHALLKYIPAGNHMFVPEDEYTNRLMPYVERFPTYYIPTTLWTLPRQSITDNFSHERWEAVFGDSTPPDIAAWPVFNSGLFDSIRERFEAKPEGLSDEEWCKEDGDRVGAFSVGNLRVERGLNIGSALYEFCGQPALQDGLVYLGDWLSGNGPLGKYIEPMSGLYPRQLIKFVRERFTGEADLHAALSDSRIPRTSQGHQCKIHTLLLGWFSRTTYVQARRNLRLAFMERWHPTLEKLTVSERTLRNLKNSVRAKFVAEHDNLKTVYDTISSEINIIKNQLVMKVQQFTEAGEKLSSFDLEKLVAEKTEPILSLVEHGVVESIMLNPQSDYDFTFITHRIIGAVPVRDTVSKRDFGRFKVSVNTRSACVKFLQLEEDKILNGYWTPSYHPHISGSGQACMGNLEELLAHCCAENDLVGVVYAILGFLGTANVADVAGRKYSLWPLAKEEGTAIPGEGAEVCIDCGRPISEGGLYTCVECGAHVCCDCVHLNSEGEEPLCDNCV